jgi:hypothetical protein
MEITVKIDPQDFVSVANAMTSPEAIMRFSDLLATQPELGQKLVAATLPLWAAVAAEIAKSPEAVHAFAEAQARLMTAAMIGSTTGIVGATTASNLEALRQFMTNPLAALAAFFPRAQS